MNNAIQLGDRVKDRISGVKGIATGITTWLWGCVRVGVQPEETKDGKPADQVWFDEPQLQLIDKAVFRANFAPVSVLEEPNPTGGPRPDPVRPADPHR